MYLSSAFATYENGGSTLVFLCIVSLQLISLHLFFNVVICFVAASIQLLALALSLVAAFRHAVPEDRARSEDSALLELAAYLFSYAPPVTLFYYETRLIAFVYFARLVNGYFFILKGYTLANRPPFRGVLGFLRASRAFTPEVTEAPSETFPSGTFAGFFLDCWWAGTARVRDIH